MKNYYGYTYGKEGEYAGIPVELEGPDSYGLTPAEAKEVALKLGGIYGLILVPASFYGKTRRYYYILEGVEFKPIKESDFYREMRRKEAEADLRRLMTTGRV